MKFRILLSPPHMSGREMSYIQEAFDTNWIAPAGPSIDAFEAGLRDFTGSPHVVALSSGTAALHLAILALGIGKGDIVLCQSLTFVASANPILYVGATPVFIDSEPESWNICPDALETAILHYLKAGRRPKAVIIVHLYGMPCQLNEIGFLCQKYGIPLIEDAAEALGSTYDGKQLGTFGDIGIFSFNGNKIITTSAGGALLTNQPQLAEKALFLATQAKEPAFFYQHSTVGFNYRMSNVCAGIGRGQLEVLNERVMQRRENFKLYQQYFTSLSTIYSQKEQSGMQSNRWLSAFRFESEVTVETVRQHLEVNDIESRRIWKPMHLQPLFANAAYFGGNAAESIFRSGLCLPSGSALDKTDIKNIGALILEAVKSKRAAPD